MKSNKYGFSHWLNFRFLIFGIFFSGPVFLMAQNNLALTGKATASSVRDGMEASKAIDGNKDSY